MKKVTVAGGGVLGSQIAFQTAYKYFDVTVWVNDEKFVEVAQKNLAAIHKTYLTELEKTKNLIGLPLGQTTHARGLIENFAALTPRKIDALKQNADKAYENIKVEVDMEKAFGNADLVIEAIPESIEIKGDFYSSIAPYLPEKTILCTNSSTLLPSMFADKTGRPDKFLALHFANEVCKNNIVEVMGHPGTDDRYFYEVVEFGTQIGMIPMELCKEQAGYILNSMLVPFLDAAQMLYAKEVADPHTIDLTWQYATGAPMGPFHILDIVGLTTAYNILSMDPNAKDPEHIKFKICQNLKDRIDKGETGYAAGKGFFTYAHVEN